jgi:hypothetical protein
MAIVTPTCRPKRARQKERPQTPIANRIVTPAPLKPRQGPVIRLRDQTPDRAHDNGEEKPQPKRSAIVTPKRQRPAIFNNAPDLTEEELRRRDNAADALWRELVRRATGNPVLNNMGAKRRRTLLKCAVFVEARKIGRA